MRPSQGSLSGMPFADEVGPVKLVAYRASCTTEFDAIPARLSDAIGALASSIDHVGSTSVPGLPAKDVIDVQVRVPRLDRQPLVQRFERIGFRLRPEPWNSFEVSLGERYEKLVFAPPVGERACNVHVRIDGQPNARFALLFRDFLRANDEARDAWGEFKTRLVAEVTDLGCYGQIKEPATMLLLEAASAWAVSTNWSPK